MDINAVINAEIELLTAIKNADVPALERLLHPDLICLTDKLLPNSLI
jgi:hypothetical protein